MNIVFFGTPIYTIPILDMLHKTFRTNEGSPIVAIVTQPPRPSGRQKLLTYSAVDDWARKNKVQKFFNPVEVINHSVDADLGILAAYGAIIPQKVIEHFKYGILNIHPSLLPNFRGASPVQATIATNSPAGATIIKLDNQMDHGPIVTSFKDQVFKGDTTEILRNRLFERSAEVLKTLIPAYLSGKVNIKKQDHKKATFTRLTKKQDGYISWEHLKSAISVGLNPSDKDLTLAQEEWKIPFIKDYTTHYSPETIHQFIQAMHPWPGVWTKIQIPEVGNQKSRKRLKILGAHLKNARDKGQNLLVLDKVQMEGKNPVTWKQFTEAHNTT